MSKSHMYIIYITCHVVCPRGYNYIILKLVIIIFKKEKNKAIRSSPGQLLYLYKLLKDIYISPIDT